MPEQLLNIHTTQAQIGQRSEQGQFTRTGKYGEHQADLTIHKESGGGLKMQRTPMKVDINTDEVLDSVSPNNATSMVENFAEKGEQYAMDAIARLARLGKMFRDPNVNGVLQSASEIVMKDTDQTYGLGWLPTVQAKTTVVPEELNFSYQMDRISLDVALGTNEFDYHPGDATTEVVQPGNVDIKYVGGMHYFPTAGKSRIDLSV